MNMDECASEYVAHENSKFDNFFVKNDDYMSRKKSVSFILKLNVVPWD